MSKIGEEEADCPQASPRRLRKGRGKRTLLADPASRLELILGVVDLPVLELDLEAEPFLELAAELDRCGQLLADTHAALPHVHAAIHLRVRDVQQPLAAGRGGAG